MGRSGSSSKRKSSKKKSFKISSEARRKKRSRRNKSKKLLRNDDSVSSCSDDESTSSSIVSSSSSESDYKSKRAQTRTQGDVKVSRKRSRKRSSSPESKSSHRVKKRKRSKRKDDSEARKKGETKKRKNKKKKKKPRSDTNISSESCSTCHGGDSSSDEESEIESLRGRSREKKKDNRDSSKGRSGNRKNRSRSSSYSKLSDRDENDSIEKLAVENNPRRLRSVITVAIQQEEKEEYEVNKDELKEEIVYDYDDYPSCRSNDSNDGGNKMDLADPSYLSSEKRRRDENVMEEVDSMSNIKADGLNICSDGTGGVSAKEKESKTSAAVGSDADDLESILRQKALENLSRFQGGLQTKTTVPANEKMKSQIGVKQLLTENVELVQSKLPKQDGSSMISAPQSLVPRSRFTWRRDPSVALKTEEKIPIGSGGDSVAAKHTTSHLPGKAGISGGSEEKEHITESSRSQAPERKLRTFPRENSSLTSSEVNKSADETSKTVSEINRSQAKLRMFPRANSTLTSSEVNKIEDETSKTVAEINSNNDGVGISDAGTSTALETPSSVSAEEHSSREQQQQTETKDSSQFEQKTMSVMRGGEMVQVSYKVYIPKKAPALARRKLKR